MAAVDLVLRRSTRIAQHPHHHHHHHYTTKRHPLNKLEEPHTSTTSENDELTPRALRALKRQRLALDTDGLLLPHIETNHRRKRRKENDNTNIAHGNVGEVRRRIRQVRVRTRAQNVPKPRHIPPLAPTIIDLPIQPVTTQESLRNVLADQPSILAPKDHDEPASAEPKLTTENKSEEESIPTTESKVMTETKQTPSSTPLDLDSLIPLDPLPEFPPSDPAYTNSSDFASNPTFPPPTDLNPFSSNTIPFPSSQPGPFGSNSFPTSFSSGFSNQFIPQPDFSPSQDSAFSNPAFPTQEYTNGYNQSNGYPQQPTFSQSNSFDYTPAPHRDREINIWKLACQERVEFLLRRYGIETIKALVASEARTPFPSPSTHSSNTRFRLYTPASYLEHASYTYKSTAFEAIDFDMDDEEDEDEDLDECDLSGDYDDDYDDDEEDAEAEDGLFSMDVEGTKTIPAPCVPAIVTPTVPTVPSILPPITPTPQKQATSPPRSTSPPGRSLLDTIPTPRPLCGSPPCSPPRRTPSPPSTPQRLSTPPLASTPTQTSCSTPASPSTSTPPPSHPTPTPQTPPPIHSPQTPPQIHLPTLPRTPPLSSLHVTLLSEPPRAFMGRGTPPDRRRLSEWGRWGCVQVYGKGGERRRLSLGHGGDHMHLQPIQCAESLGMGMGQLRKEDMARHENPQPLQLTEHQPLQQHEDSHPHPNPHEDPPHTHAHAHAVPGEWTSFLFAMLEGDRTGSAGWYELGAQGSGEGMGADGVPQSMNLGVLGGTQGMVGSLGGAQTGLDGTQGLGMGAQNLGMSAGGQGLGMGSMTQPVSIGEADSTLRFALG
ncbi:uncharacterized protein EDB93DRAFT_1108681 [Suillus bovinus]|uniref:uncharacterized protein n=1 Tax=Suillus bovinus TaxID=48563 RepID=UPI001B878B6D|nr:uncharacterized protein EDB93DRAFT_1108681 [Suillus bovinus]KAG2129504.1 hypothetical protein EDB93DRAFT_1108681 [Suillus bovinus]